MDYQYEDQNGTLVLTVHYHRDGSVRISRPKGQTRNILYRMKALVENPNKPIWIIDHERACRDFSAEPREVEFTTIPGNLLNWYPEYNGLLYQRDVTFVTNRWKPEELKGNHGTIQYDPQKRWKEIFTKILGSSMSVSVKFCLLEQDLIDFYAECGRMCGRRTTWEVAKERIMAAARPIEELVTEEDADEFMERDLVEFCRILKRYDHNRDKITLLALLQSMDAIDRDVAIKRWVEGPGRYYGLRAESIRTVLRENYYTPTGKEKQPTTLLFVMWLVMNWKQNLHDNGNLIDACCYGTVEEIAKTTKFKSAKALGKLLNQVLRIETTRIREKEVVRQASGSIVIEHRKHHLTITRQQILRLIEEYRAELERQYALSEFDAEVEQYVAEHGINIWEDKWEKFSRQLAALQAGRFENEKNL